MRTKFHFKPENGFTIDNGYVKEVEELGEKIEFELEELGYRITVPSFTDWGYALNATLTRKTVAIIIEIENLEEGSFEITYQPHKKWYQVFSNFSMEIELVHSQIRDLALNMNFK